MEKVISLLRNLFNFSCPSCGSTHIKRIANKTYQCKHCDYIWAEDE